MEALGPWVVLYQHTVDVKKPIFEAELKKLDLVNSKNSILLEELKKELIGSLRNNWSHTIHNGN